MLISFLRLYKDKQFDEGKALLDDGKRQYPEVGCWARLQLILTKAITEAQKSPKPVDGELTFDGYTYSSWNAFKGKIEKVRKVRKLKPEEKDRIRTFVELNKESNKKLKRDLKNDNVKKYLAEIGVIV